VEAREKDDSEDAMSHLPTTPPHAWVAEIDVTLPTGASVNRTELIRDLLQEAGGAAQGAQETKEVTNEN
jgi:hypothetical protein